MGFVEAVTTCLKKSFDIEGRAGRAEFWYWVLFIFLVNGVIVFTMFFFGQQFTLLYLSLFPAYYSVTVRRLHDLDLSGFTLLLFFIPLFFIPLLLLLLCVPRGKKIVLPMHLYSVLT